MRWGWRCAGCGHERYAALKQRAVLQCNRCKRQVSLTAGTIFHSTKLPLATWFLSIYHLAQSKGGISSIELGRRGAALCAVLLLMLGAVQPDPVHNITSEDSRLTGHSR